MTQSVKTPALDISKCTLPAITTPGAKFKTVKTINLNKIYVPPFTNNPVRKKGKNLEHIDKLTISFSHGIDYTKRLPVVRKCNRIIDGKHYDWELVAGNHRMEALTRNGYQTWLFDVYEFGLNVVSFEDSLLTFQLEENNHVPQLEASMDDAANIIIRLIEHKSKLVKNNEKSIGEYVDSYCGNMHHQTKGKVIRTVVSACGAYQDVVTYTPIDIVKWVNTYTNMSTSGDYDSKRKKHGWSVKEGYEYEYVMNASRKFFETGKESYFICHTKSPTEMEDLSDKRVKMLAKFQELEEALLDVFEYYEENGKFPWSVEGFLPADKKNQEDMTKLVSTKDVVKVATNLFGT